MTGRNDLAGLRPDLAGRTGQNQPLDLATSPPPIGGRRRGELDEQQTHPRRENAPGEVRRAARWLTVAVYLQPVARRRQLLADIEAAAAAIDRRPEVTR